MPPTVSHAALTRRLALSLPPLVRFARSKDPGLHYTAFDFHKECGAKNYHR